LCPGTYPLPRDLRARGERGVYRLQEMCVLGCGHMDAHWVYECDERRTDDHVS